MGQYICGDVLLASVALDSRAAKKTRPVIVIRTDADGTVHICPVSSKPPTDAPSLPLTIDDFAQGGLDLFSESYVMTSRITAIRPGDVIGKKGRLTTEMLAEIFGRIGVAMPSGLNPSQQKKISGKKRDRT